MSFYLKPFLILLCLVSFTPSMAEDGDRARRRAYAGGADEEDLKVQDGLALATRKIDAKTIQQQVFKSLYSKEADSKSSSR